MILIVGAAGYIGSHTLRNLRKNGHECVVVDNLSEGHKEAVGDTPFYQVDLSDVEGLRKVFSAHSIDAVIHFAAFAYVGESVTDPSKYYQNNVVNTLNLLNVMREFDVKKIIFSSTCATYGQPERLPIDETHPQNPINPYGRTKLMIEKILEDYDRAYGLRYIALRYFNAAGANPAGDIGESHRIETHLITLVLWTALGKLDEIKVFGDDYDTEDGSCVRDYIHVDDLAKAHRLALQQLLDGGASDIYNLGTGNGFSVKQVIEVCKEVTGLPIKFSIAPRREGDPAVLFADNKKAAEKLGWTPDYTDLREIVKTAWTWEQDRQY